MPKLMKRRPIRKAELLEICERQYKSYEGFGDPVRKPDATMTKASLMSWIKALGFCEFSGERISNQDVDFDHKIPNALLYEGDKVDWQVILRKWHKVKTADDVARIAKAKRQAGETGQQARRAASRPSLGKVRDISGKKFNRLFVISFSGRKGGKAYWDCECDCGELVTVRGSSLQAGRTGSCGCYGSERRKEHPRTHGMSGTPEYSSWESMRQRCLNPKSHVSKHYSQRGIEICSDWDDFEVFLKDMGKRPSLLHSIERIDNSQGYNPKNCVWATQKQQTRNTRQNVNLEHNGLVMCLTDWSLHLGVSRSAIESRLRNGWSVDRALSTPVKKYNWGRKTNAEKVVDR